MSASQRIQSIRRFVVKIGSSVLTDDAGRLLPERLERCVEQVSACVASPAGRSAEAIIRQPVIVSSGAIACGMAKLGLPKRPKALEELQACAAIGQSELMHLYTVAFARHGVTTAQLLLTQDDFADRRRYHNAKQTLQTLLSHRVVPVINENDTVAVEEIAFGDNDRLAALVASAIEAQLLIILSDVDGLLERGRVIERVETLARARQAILPGGKRQTTTGGMASKLEAARIVGHSGIPMVIANGARASVVTDVLAGEPVGTLFVPARKRLEFRKWWIAFARRRPSGTLRVDDGAARALVERGKSLLPSGIRAVEGAFEAGSCVAIASGEGLELARGIAGFSSSELRRILGMSSADAAKALGQPKAHAAVHRNQLVLMKDLSHE